MKDLKEIYESMKGALKGRQNANSEQCVMVRNKIILRIGKHVALYCPEMLKRKRNLMYEVYCTHCGQYLDSVDVKEVIQDPMEWERHRGKIIGQHKHNCQANMQGEFIMKGGDINE